MFILTNFRYFVNVLDDATEVYSSGQWTDAASQSSAALGDADGGSNWVVEFECNLEFSLFSCEDGAIEFALVDCGCPEGEAVAEECVVSSLANAQDAVCEPTLAPTSAPPTTAAPSLRPTTAAPITAAPVTAAPVTASPVAPSPSPPSAGGVCFSGETTVEVQGQSLPVPMKDLKIGDSVLTQSKTYQPVYAFAHKDITKTIEYLQIHTPGTAKAAPLEMTAEHMLYVNGKKAPVRADALKVGDTLASATSKDDQHHVVKKITKVTRQGLYAPLTPDGTIVVANGIVASNYISMQEKSSSYVDNGEQYVVLSNGMNSGIGQADVAHIFLTPMRLWCLGVSSEMCNVQDEDGKHPYVAFGLNLAKVMDNEAHYTVQMMLLALIFTVMGPFMLIESLFGATCGPLALFLVCATIAQWIRARDCIGSKKKVA